MRRFVRRLYKDRDGAVAPIVALSLTGLLAAGGVAFDYARMASMDTELQNAADQAALAAATQLDGQSNACARAANAAHSMLVNRTLMANDSASSGTQVSIPLEASCDATGHIGFYQDIAHMIPASTDAQANFVMVTVDSRTAFYALTPIVGALSSGAMSATAYAGLHQAICKVPPVMICNPQETGTSTSLDVSALVGKGLKLVNQGGGTGTWAPGNYGYLNTNITSVSGAVNQLRAALGWETPPGDCVPESGVDTKPGVSTTVTDALNTRFDIYQNGITSCLTGGNCGPSIDSVKDVARNANANGTNGCAYNTQGWNQGTTSKAYGWGTIPSSGTTALDLTQSAQQPSIMGDPRDMCHSVPAGAPGSCQGNPVGNGSWDRDAYFWTNYKRSDGTRWSHANWMADTGLSATATRYQVYQWEIAHRGQAIDGVTILGPRVVSGNGASAFTSYGAPVCSPRQSPSYGSGVVPDALTPDRRKISVAVVNCRANSVNGSSANLQVLDWIDVFLVQPSLNRNTVTNDGDIYVEVVGRTNNATSTGAVQLIKKSVPYLIE